MLTHDFTWTGNGDGETWADEGSPNNWTNGSTYPGNKDNEDETNDNAFITADAALTLSDVEPFGGGPSTIQIDTLHVKDGTETAPDVALDLNGQNLTVDDIKVDAGSSGENTLIITDSDGENANLLTADTVSIGALVLQR